MSRSCRSVLISEALEGASGHLQDVSLGWQNEIGLGVQLSFV